METSASKSILLYYAAFALYLVASLLYTTTIPSVAGFATMDVIRVLQVLSASLLLVRFVLSGPNPLECIVAFGLIAVGHTTIAASGGLDWLFWLALLVVASKDVDLGLLSKIAFVVILSLLVATMVAANSGIAVNREYWRSTEVRYAEGFVHPNTLGYYMFLVWLSLSCIVLDERRRLPLWTPAIPTVLLVVLQAINMQAADSRTSLLMSLVALPVFFLFYFVRAVKARRVVIIILLTTIAILIALSYYLMICYDASSDWQVAMDQILSTRFSSAHYYYVSKPLSLFGNTFDDIPSLFADSATGIPVTLVMDNAYDRLLAGFGIVPTILVLGGLGLLFVRLLRRNRLDGLCFGLTMALLYGLSETVGIRVEWNYFLIALGPELLYTKNSLLQRAWASLKARLASAVTPEQKDSDAPIQTAKHLRH